MSTPLLADRGWRLGLGLLLSELLAIPWIRWLAHTRPSDLQSGMLGLIAIGFVGGLVMRSWWGAILAPAASTGASDIIGAVTCIQGCQFWQDDTPFVQFMLGIVYLGLPIALGAILGIPFGKWLGRIRS